MSNRIYAENLVKFYGKRQVVKGVTIEVEEGKIVGLLGPNGAGKTTTFSMIMGAIPSDGGRVFLNNEDITYLPMYLRARKGIGYLPQEASIFQNLSVEENLLAICEVLPMRDEDVDNKIELILEKLNLKHLRKQKAYTLSGGEKRRCEIARILLTSPKFLLLDEPFTGIDPITVHELKTIVNDIKSQGLGVLITDHNVQDTLDIVDEAYIIYDGQILIKGSAEELVSSEEARRIYLGEKFKLR
jgi:lipopolysaccharide export system ATP-binding protein